LAVTDREHGLWLLAADDLAVHHRWQLRPEAIGSHGIRAADRTVLVSGTDTVELLDADGRRVWRYPHLPWKHGGHEAGCAWFDADGRAFAVVPAPDYDGCEITALSARDGTPTQRVPIPTAPAGVDALHHASGWVGLSVGEGQDGAYAWWARIDDDALEV